MRRRALALGTLLYSVAAAPPGQAREHPRDFPNGTLCPIHLGWTVDEFTTEPDPASPVRIREELLFVAESRSAIITFLACDEAHDPDGFYRPVDVWLDDVRVVDRTAYEAHQALLTPPVGRPRNLWCYFGNSTPEEYDVAVGSVFAPAGTSRVRPFTRLWPFADDFDHPTRSTAYWELVAASIQDKSAVEPKQKKVLVLAQGEDTGRRQCGLARLHVPKLRPGTEYVVDFKWRVHGIDDQDIHPLTTSIDVRP